MRCNFLPGLAEHFQGARLTFEQELNAECNKLITRHERYVRELRDDDRRRTRRTGVAHRGTVMRPPYWVIDRSFDPYRVRASISPISRALKLALRHHDYQPYNPIAYEVPKSDGATRIVSVADSLVSRRIYSSLLEKNKPSLSAYSYAYRDDLTVHDAIHNIGADLRSSQRVFLAEETVSGAIAVQTISRPGAAVQPTVAVTRVAGPVAVAGPSAAERKREWPRASFSCVPVASRSTASPSRQSTIRGPLPGTDRSPAVQASR
jgi:hypothetical protein